MHHLLEPNSTALAEWLAAHGQPAYRAGQVRRWLFSGRARSIADMTDLPATLREALAQEFRIWTSEIARHNKTGDGTEKLLVRLADGQQIECVLLRDGERRTICISTQVGCAMGCVFCASGLDGVVRNLTAGEIVEQMLLLDRLLPEGERLSHVVVMGMGEPLANVDRLLPALRRSDGRGRLGDRRPADHDFDRRHSQGHAAAGGRELPLSIGRFAACARRRAAQPTGAGE